MNIAAARVDYASAMCLPDGTADAVCDRGAYIYQRLSSSTVLANSSIVMMSGKCT